MLQKNVGVPALGCAGQEVVVGQSIFASFNPMSDGTVGAGQFAFVKDDNSEGVKFGLVSSTGTGTPLGVVARVVDSVIADAKEEVIDKYPQGMAVSVAIRGQIYAVATATAANGKKVLVNPTTGVVTYGDTATGDNVDTGWSVVIPNGGATALDGDVIIYEKF